MTKVRFICLANSRKLNGRCVAGWWIDRKMWIRPVSDESDGTLLDERLCQDGIDPSVLDVIEADVVEPCPEVHQPENWVIGLDRWEWIERLDATAAERHLEPVLVDDPILFGNTGDRVDYAQLKEKKAKESLALIEPDSIKWLIEKNLNGDRQTRCRFRLAGRVCYNLSVTDPEIERRLEKLPLGIHPKEVRGSGIQTRDRVFLAISLGEPFRPGQSVRYQCFKLIAGVIVLSPN